MRRATIGAALIAAGLAGAGAVLAPPAWRLWAEREVAEDPAALASLRLEQALDEPRLRDELDAALAARDAELAESFVAAARLRGLTVPPERLAAIAALQSQGYGDSLAEFGHGFAGGSRESGPALAGALAADVSGVGDLRDLAVEGRKWLDGEPSDAVVLSLAAAGLALTAATVWSLGAALPARRGLTLVKSATKARLVSPALAASFVRVGAGAIDGPALKASLAAAGRLDFAAARVASGGIVRPAALSRLTRVGGEAGELYGRVGQRGFRQVLAVAENADDLGRAAKLSAGLGQATRATLKVLGRGALVLGALSLQGAGLMLTLLGYALALAMAAQRLGWWLGRRLIPAPAPRPVAR